MATDRRPVALVTGAAGGIGGAIASALGAAGFDLVLPGRDITSLDGLKAQLDSTGVASTAITYDLTDDDSRESFVKAAFAAFGGVDCLVNNAGVSVMSRGDIRDVTPESLDLCVSVNLRAQFFLTQAVARRMICTPSSRQRTIVTVTTFAVDHHF